ncbi:MAG: ABC transporter permease [Chloroflexota bacterium]
MADSVLKQKKSNIATITSEKDLKSRSIYAIATRRFFQHKMAVAGTIMLTFIVLYVTVGAAFFTEADGNRTSILDKTEAPSAEFWFGSDLVGRDIFVRTIYGGQISIAIGVVSVFISICLGTLIGVLSGFFGGVVDALLGRLTEMFLSIPPLILLLVLSSVIIQSSTTMTILGREISSTVVFIVALIGLTSWMQLSRIVRGQVLSLKEQEYIMAARAIGASNWGIISRHLLPNIIAPVIVAATLGIGTAIITEAYLSFLGFGVQPPTATWGNILTGAQDRIDTVWWMWMAPGFFIVCTVLAINFIGDGLRDALDPRSIQ